ncbi:MAG: Z1 domain-containing protein [Geminicoccaceae bacterium]|nr:Z1 domain-containing protein [Geminicoccaceae bacterium]
MDERRGLVVGHVQSGKTASYTGLICKAADAGYTVVIVLAGLHSNLRSQTQLRLDEGFLGYDSASESRGGGRQHIPLGVGRIDPELRPDTITTRLERGDFSRRVANNFAINPGRQPLLFVVKKNARVLKNLLDWVLWAANDREKETGRRLVSGVPLLVIDDEADHASVDTKEQPRDENGAFDEEHDPTRINGLIRRILFAFEKSAYVGYTATPFANIFIHEQGRTAEHGEDLFPRSFIVSLPVPSNYAGPARVFGLAETADRETLPPLPLIRHVPDEESGGWVPPKHRNGHRPRWRGGDDVPPSLEAAIRAFVLVCAARRARGRRGVHNSMLVHVTRFTAVQKEVKRQVEAALGDIGRRLRHGTAGGDPVRLALRRLWEEDFLPTTDEVVRVMRDPALPPLAWGLIEPELANAAADIRVMEINGTTGDALAYEEHKATGLNVVAVGGDKLARGLTLEGLSVSYFLRATRMYDTLMQMGRWFGYRPGYLDLCRLYTTTELAEWFGHIAEAGEELRGEFERMATVGGTSRDYGLKVQSHPTMLVTSRVKMRHGTEMRLSYAGTVSETTVFDTGAGVRRRNLAATGRLLARLGPPTPHRKRDNVLFWPDMQAATVLEFLDAFATHPEAPKAHSGLLRQFIQAQNAIGELTEWSIAVLPGGEAPVRLASFDVPMVRRACKPGTEQAPAAGRYVVRRLLSPRDEGLDLDEAAWRQALADTVEGWERAGGEATGRDRPAMPSGEGFRKSRSRNRGLLLIYPLNPSAAGGGVPFVGIGLSFPSSDSARTVSYRVNNVYWQQELEDAA